MNLWTGSYLWQTRDVPSTPLSSSTLNVDVAVIGAGVTGALIADIISEQNIGCAVLDSRPPARGSTLASTAIVQYELDISLADLSQKIGWVAALRVYRLCFQAVQTLRQLATGLEGNVGLEACPALYLSPEQSDLKDLRREFDARQQAGFEIEWLDSGDIAARYPWQAAAALYNRDALLLDPVAFTTRLLERVSARGGVLVASSRIVRIEPDAGGITLYDHRGWSVRCRRAIFAGGYETSEWLPGLKRLLTSSYAGATGPGQEVTGWEDRCTVWDTRRPYTYLRRTVDNRVVVGGRDKPFRKALLRDALLPIERLLLQRTLRHMLNDDSVRLPLAWTGTFAESPDAMPLIGERPDLPGVLFVFGCGGNGITFATVARGLVPDWLAGRPSSDLSLFAMDRPSLGHQRPEGSGPT